MKIKFAICLLGFLFVYPMLGLSSIVSSRVYCPQTIICTMNYCDADTATWVILSSVKALAGTYKFSIASAQSNVLHGEEAQCSYHKVNGDYLIISSMQRKILYPDVSSPEWEDSSFHKNKQYQCASRGYSHGCPFVTKEPKGMEKQGLTIT